MYQDQDFIKHLLDAGAGGVALLGIVSHFAEIISPIATLLLTVMSIVWLAIRFRHWLRTGRTEA